MIECSTVVRQESGHRVNSVPAISRDQAHVTFTAICGIGKSRHSPESLLNLHLRSTILAWLMTGDEVEDESGGLRSAAPDRIGAIIYAMSLPRHTRVASKPCGDPSRLVQLMQERLLCLGHVMNFLHQSCGP